jgi:hypothetical protein
VRVVRHGASLALALALVADASHARAQCGAQRSTCSGCHDDVRAPYRADASPHPEHAFADLCVACHGGRGDAREAPAAHEGVRTTVGVAVCAGCHPGSLPGAKSSPTTDARPSAPHGRAGPNLALAAVAAALGAVATRLVVVRRREPDER